MALTLKLVQKALKDFNVVIRKNDGEYRVNFRDGSEESAYYTDDILDAFRTGMAMVGRPYTKKSKARRHPKAGY